MPVMLVPGRMLQLLWNVSQSKAKQGKAKQCAYIRNV